MKRNRKPLFVRSRSNRRLIRFLALAAFSAVWAVLMHSA